MKPFRQLREEIQLEGSWDSTRTKSQEWGRNTGRVNQLTAGKTHGVIGHTFDKGKHIFSVPGGNGEQHIIDANDHEKLKDHLAGLIKGNHEISSYIPGPFIPGKPQPAKTNRIKNAGEHTVDSLHHELTKNITQNESLDKDLVNLAQRLGGTVRSGKQPSKKVDPTKSQIGFGTPRGPSGVDAFTGEKNK